MQLNTIEIQELVDVGHVSVVACQAIEMIDKDNIDFRILDQL